MKNTYQEIVAWMAEQMPMFQTDGATAYHPGLKNILDLAESLGNPQNKFKSIHIAGTNGKGSTANMLASILQESRLKVGLFTSPHLKDYRERIRINGKMISEKAVIQFIEDNKEELGQNKYSFFEMNTAMAFQYFAEEKVDIAIIETGLGGKLDSTNIITPILSIITSIGIDHSNILGDSLEEIAYEKGGIIKKEVPVIIGEVLKETEAVFRNLAEEKKAKLILSDKLQALSYELELKGKYQQYNANTVLRSIEELREQGFKITEEDISKGLKEVSKNTGLLGRWQKLGDNPLIICDTGHNAHAIKILVEQILEQEYNKLHIVFGMVSDKDIEDVLRLLPKEAAYYFCAPNTNRAMDAELLKEKASKYNLFGKSFESIALALKAAKETANERDMIFIGGSNFVIAEII